MKQHPFEDLKDPQINDIVTVDVYHDPADDAPPAEFDVDRLTLKFADGDGAPHPIGEVRLLERVGAFDRRSAYSLTDDYTLFGGWQRYRALVRESYDEAHQVLLVHEAAMFEVDGTKPKHPTPKRTAILVLHVQPTHLQPRRPPE